ncbi:MAG: hypothetical protein IPJ87_01530 [Flavobacteriales bacterium]|nr:hypothetical protein [Flavobacteriales bacterium]
MKPQLERGPDRKNKFEVVLRPTKKQLEEGRIDVDEDPLWLENRLYYEWEELDDAEVAPPDYGIVVPSGYDDVVWRLLPTPGGNVKTDVIEGLPASAFDDAGGSGDFVTHLSRAVICDPTARIVEVTGGITGTIARMVFGTYLNRPFLFGDGYSGKGALETYRVVEAGDATGAIIQSLSRAPVQSGPLHGVINLWLANGAEKPAVVKGALKHTNFLEQDPKTAIGNPQTGMSYSSDLAKRIAGTQPGQLDYLFDSNDRYYVNTPSTPVHWLSGFKGKYGIDPTGHLHLLAIADPNLGIITGQAAHDSVPNVLVFTYGSSKSKVYSWTWKNGEAPTQRLLIDGSEQKFELTDEMLSDYVQALNTAGCSSDEDSLFIGMALGRIKRDEVVWLDWFREGAGVNDRLVLCAAGKVQKARDGVMSVSVTRIGDGRTGVKVPLILKLTDAGSEPVALHAFRKRYSSNMGWKKPTLYEKVLANPVPQDFWLSLTPDRVGIVTAFRSNRYVSVFLQDKRRRFQFGPDLWEDMRDSIADDRLIYIPGGAPNDPGVLLRSCLKNEHGWERNYWRANPLGYFDRVPNSRL